MGKRYQNQDDDMEITKLHEDLGTLKRQMGEVLFILGGSASYDYKGMRAEVKELKLEVSNVKTEVENIKNREEEKKKKEGFFSIKLDTIPQKIVALVAFIAVIVSIAQGLKTLFTQ